MPDVSPRFLCDEQIPNPLPDGVSLWVHPSGSDAPVLDGDNENYWEMVMGYERYPTPPPPGFVYVVYTTRRPGQFGSFSHCEIRTLPVLPDGEYWRVITAGVHRDRIAVPQWCQPALPGTNYQHGPSAFDCPVMCLYRDGCFSCNPTVWRSCIGGGCPVTSRVPVEFPDEESCPCFIECAQCRDEHPPVDLTAVLSGVLVCRLCRARDYSYCSHCQEYELDHEFDDHVDSCRTDCECGECEEGRSSGGNLINDYSFTPHLKFHGEGTYHLGMELELNTAECSSSRRAAETVVDHFGDLVYLKEDSSIDEGFEMVTHPMTLEYALNVDWSVLRELDNNHNVQASGDCGMHVHVSKTAFDTASHTYRWMRFIYRNADNVQALARRRGSSYASFHSYMNDWAIHYASQSKKPFYSGAPSHNDWYMRTEGGRKRTREVGIPSHTQRYAAINVENEQTFELRFFASTLYPVQVRAALGFVHASVEYTRQLTANKVVTEKGLEFDTFRAWLSGNNTDDRYKDLISELERLVN